VSSILLKQYRNNKTGLAGFVVSAQRFQLNSRGLQGCYVPGDNACGGCCLSGDNARGECAFVGAGHACDHGRASANSLQTPCVMRQPLWGIAGVMVFGLLLSQAWPAPTTGIASFYSRHG